MNYIRTYNVEEYKGKTSSTKLAVIVLSILVFSVSAIIFAYYFSIVKTQNASEDAATAAANKASSSAQILDIANNLRQRTVDKVVKKAEIPAYSYSEVSSMDMSKPSGVTVSELKLVTKYNLVGLEDTLHQIEQDYNLNCLLLLGIASHESAYGTSQFHPNNLCGYGYSGFSSKEECLQTVGKALATSYLDPSGSFYKGNTIDAVNKTYAADPAWDSKVAKKVTYFYEIISEARSAQLDKLKE